MRRTFLAALFVTLLTFGVSAQQNTGRQYTATSPIVINGQNISCPICETTAPTLNQVLDPTADKAFVMAAHELTFDWSSEPANGTAIGLNLSKIPGPDQFFGGGETMAVAQAGGAALNVEAYNNGGQDALQVFSVADTLNINPTGIEVEALAFGTANQGLLTGIHISNSFTSSGTLLQQYGMQIALFPGVSSTVTASTGIDIQNQSSGGTVGIGIGLQVEDQSGASSNFSIKTGLGKLSFGDTATTYGGLTLASSTGALGWPAQVGYARALAQTSSIGATTLFGTGGNDALYRASIDVDCTSTAAGETLTPAIRYTDTSNTVQTISGSNAVCTSLGSASFSSQTVSFQAKASTNIQYLVTTGVGITATWNVRVSIEQLSLQ